MADRLNFYCVTKNSTIELNAEYDVAGGYYKVMVFGGLADQCLEIYAMVDGIGKQAECDKNCRTVGKINIYTMKYRKKRVAVVPVMCDARLSGDVEKNINKMFAPLGRMFNFVEKERFDGNDTLKQLLVQGLNTREEGNVFTNETEEMKYLRRLYKNTSTIDRSADAYLFLLPANKVDGINGYMPRTSSVGYIFVDNDTTPSNPYSDHSTVEHELCHGLFGLQHTFDYGVGEKYPVDNIMSYSMQEDRYPTKYFQWNQIQNPTCYKFPFVDDAEDGESNTGNKKKNHYIVTNHKAVIRTYEKNPKTKKEVEKETDSLLAYGLEVVKLGNKGKNFWVKDVDPAVKDTYYTLYSNLTIIKDIPHETKTFAVSGKSVVLPYSATENTPAPVKGDTCTVIAQCGLYYRVLYDKFTETPDTNSSKGYWVHKQYFPTSENAKKKIQKALEEVEKYIGTGYHMDCFGKDAFKDMNDYLDNAIDTTLKYKEDWTPSKLAAYLRTSEDADALKEMDCTEFMARFVGKVFGGKVPNFSTGVLEPYAKTGKCFGNKFYFVEGSKNDDFKDIRPGDMFIWRSTGSGHVGVVVSYDQVTDLVTIYESVQSSNDETSSYTIKDCVDSSAKKIVCHNQVRKSVYKRNGTALAKHKGWKGYFRLNIE